MEVTVNPEISGKRVTQTTACKRNHKRCPRCLRKLTCKKRHLWRKLRSNKDDVVIRREYRDCVNEWPHQLKSFERKVENSVIVAMVYTQLLSVAAVPAEWKRAIITPVFKNSPAGNVCNYRPISLTCVPSKVMKRVIAQQISDHLMSNNILHHA